NGERPGGAAGLGGLLAHDGELQRFKGGADVVGGDVEAELFVDVGRGDGDLAFPRDVGADLADGAGDLAAGVGEDEVDEAVQGLVEGVRIDVAFVAVGGVGGDAELARGAADAAAFEDGDFEDEVGGVGGDAGVLAADDAGDDERFFGVGDDEVLRGERALLAVEGEEFFAVAGGAHDDLVAGEFFGIEGVHGLAVFEHHVVADIDDVVDRAQADGGQALADPVGRRADFDAGDDGGGVERAGLGGFDTHGLEQLGVRVGIDGGGGESNFRIREILEEPGGEFAGDADVVEAVGAVGRDLDVEHGVAGGQHVVDGRADGRFAGEQVETVGGLREGEFAGGAQHAGGGLAADLGFLDGEVAGQRGGGQRDGHAVAGVAVVRAADDGAHAAVGLADVHGADGKFVGVGVLVAGEDVADHGEIERGRAGLDDLLDLEAEEGDGARDVVVGRGAEINVGLEPGTGNFHWKKNFFGHRVHGARTQRSRRNTEGS